MARDKVQEVVGVKGRLLGAVGIAGVLFPWRSWDLNRDPVGAGDMGVS